MTTSSLSMTPQRIALSLSREELYVVMKLLKAASLPGFDLAWLKAAPDGTVSDEIHHALEVATNALIARGFLAPQPTAGSEPMRVNIPAPVVSLVGACAFGEDSILLSLRTPDGPRLLYLHELRGLGVVHTMPLPDMHQFEAVDGRTGILGVIDDVLGLHMQTAASLPAGKALAVDVQAARDAAIAGNVPGAVELLVHGGLPVVTAHALGRAMQEATALGAIAIAKRDADGQQHEATLAIVVTPTVCFALADEGPPPLHPAAFYVQPTSAQALRQWIASSLP